MSVAEFQNLFRLAAGIEVDGTDLTRYNAVVTRKLYDLLLAGQASAAARRRYIIEPEDLPITRAMQENIRVFASFEHRIELERILAQLALYPPLDRIPATETKALFPDIIGGLTVALARTLAVVHPTVTTPEPGHWEMLRTLVDLYL